MKKILPGLLVLVTLLALGACQREAESAAGCRAR